ncbi:MAG: hypothetical protein IPJ89_04475 [Candidatus Iainarchaeum archaeon]|uniref:Uncharacterized protein n=1 Tax=Candidatus Iainarchaeum sp. TaxID=3101447 RepID=A0A7T9DJB0_9ARCH|nr:MAG: hypothetical protein IPJ89_04475 [Candidatus Diapherotrites archaeon]
MPIALPPKTRPGRMPTRVSKTTAGCDPMANLTIWNWMRFHPLRFSLILFGMALLLFSMNARAYGFASASLSGNEFWMQPGSDVRAHLDVDITSSELVPISFSINQVEGITIDGALHGIATTGKFSRQIRIDVSRDVPPGDYALQLTMHASLDGQTYHYPFPIIVHVSQKERVTYFTSSNSTLSPSIDRIQLSPRTISLQRGEVQYATVSFRNLGNPTDYAIEFNPQPIGIFASVVTPNHSFVDAGETVRSDIELRAFTTSPFETIPVSVYARNRVTQEKMFLGNIDVTVTKTTNALLSVPFQSIQLEKGASMQSFLTIQNTESSDLDVLLQSSSPSVELSATQLHIPANSSLSVPVTLNGSTSLGKQTETIYVFNSDYDNSVSFTITTVPAVIVLDEVETRTLEVVVENDSGAEWDNITMQLRNLPTGWKATIVPARASLLQGESLTAVLRVTAPKSESASLVVLVYDDGVLVKTIHVQSHSNPSDLSRITGFVSGIARPLIGVLVLIVAALIVFSADFRARMRKMMPKPKPFVKEVKATIGVSEKTPPSKSDTPSSPAA